MVNSKNGNVLLLLISGVALISLSLAGYLYWQNQQLSNKVTAPTQKPSVPQPVKSVDKTAIPDLIGANWKTFQDNDFGYALKYPENIFKYRDLSIASLFAATSQPKGGNGPKFLGANDLWLEANINKMTFFQSISELEAFIASNPGLSKAQKTSTTIGGSPAYKLAYQMQTGDAGTSSATEFFFRGMVIRNDSLYTISLSSWNQETLNRNAQLFDQILSTFKFTQPTAINPNSNTFTSASLGITFNYASQPINNEAVLVKELGNKVYVYGTRTKDFTRGQWLEAFPKDRSDTLVEAVKKRFLSNYSPSDCFAIPYTTKFIPNHYPTSFQIAIIDVPRTSNEGFPIAAWAKCPEPYVTENGVSYFLMDQNIPDKFIYLSIGQYGIPSGISPTLMWEDTIKFIK